MDLKECFEKAGLPWPFPPRSLNYAEYCLAIKIAVPHGPYESCTCVGCGACEGQTYGCTCDIDWELARDIRDLWYA